MQRLDTERQLPISIIMADLNGLKLINDTYGHSTGDEVLKRTAAILREICRSEDILARLGGDEFVIYLPHTPENKALAMGRRISQAFLQKKINDVPITISIGVATKTSIEQTIASVLRAAEDKMYQNKLTESSSGKSAVLNALLKTLAEKSFETEVHTRNMQTVAMKIGEKLRLPDSEMHRLRLLITLHDIGKINTPEELLTKSSPLSDAEWEVMKKHCETGYRIARATDEFAYVAEDILTHHEHWDGSGYPQGLKGEAIPLLARVTTLADAYEVMCNGRPYKQAMTPEAIRAEFKRCTGGQFDPQLVELMLEVIH
jgi:diguanylate cyclase (GGDEF)-like protein